MDGNQLYIARVLFQARMLKSDARKFQDLFVEVMRKGKPNFRPVKPWGKQGDKKNDGFERDTGRYYQVYGPEDIENKDTISYAVSKLREDFEGLYENWNEVYPIKEFYYVINDKYKGVAPVVYATLRELEKKYSGVKFDVFLSDDLERVFKDLPESDIIELVGFIPSVNIEVISFSALTNVVEYLVDHYKPYSTKERFTLSDFDEKIVFNKLGKPVEALLTAGSYQASVLDDFFERDSFTKDILRDIFKGFYDEGMHSIEEWEGNNDKVFFYILEKATPEIIDARHIKQVQDAILVLMAYYFETCDLFETPTKGG